MYNLTFRVVIIDILFYYVNNYPKLVKLKS
jgi:hypothetical protein